MLIMTSVSYFLDLSKEYSVRTIRDIGAIPTGMNSLLDFQYKLFQLLNQLQGNYIQEMTTEQGGLIDLTSSKLLNVIF